MDTIAGPEELSRKNVSVEPIDNFRVPWRLNKLHPAMWDYQLFQQDSPTINSIQNLNPKLKLNKQNLINFFFL